MRKVSFVIALIVVGAGSFLANASILGKVDQLIYVSPYGQQVLRNIVGFPEIIIGDHPEGDQRLASISSFSMKLPIQNGNAVELVLSGGSYTMLQHSQGLQWNKTIIFSGMPVQVTLIAANGKRRAEPSATASGSWFELSGGGKPTSTNMVVKIEGKSLPRINPIPTPSVRPTTSPLE